MDWTEADGTLQRDYEFGDFSEALAFVNRVGALAEERNHHPDLLLHGYRHVRVMLTTHDAGDRVTDADRALAEAISAL